MQPDDTRASYDSIASHWASDAFHAENGMEQHRRALQFLNRQEANSTTTALDVGCGSSGRLIELLIETGFEVEGLDISTEMLALAPSRHPNITFHQADFCEWSFPRQYDFITAWDSVWHIPLARQGETISKLCGGLTAGGVLIFSAGGTDEPDEVTNDCHGARSTMPRWGFRTSCACWTNPIASAATWNTISGRKCMSTSLSRSATSYHGGR